MENSGTTQSCWMNVDVTEYQPLTGDTEADVCVVGAGIAGLSTAYQLALEGKRVVVLDARGVGGGETCRTTAHLTNAFDDRYHHLEHMHGEEVSCIVAHSHTAAIDRIEAIAQFERIACDFRRVDGYLFTPPDASNAELGKELEAAHRAGLHNVILVENPPGTCFPLGPALKFSGQGQINPMAYLEGLAKAFVRRGGRIYGGTHVDDVADGSPTRVTTRDGYTVTAAATVVATNTPINNRFIIHTKQAPYRSFVIGMAVPKGAVPWALWWDTLDPYHYVRLAGELDNGLNLLIAGGEDHKTGQADDAEERFARLASWVRERFPVVGEVLYQWSGQIMEPVDALAFIGRNPGDNHVYIATGDSGNGMTHGTIAGMLLSDLIGGRDNPWRQAYDPARKALMAVGEFAKENINVAAQYTDWLTAGNVDDLHAIPVGEGAIVRHHLNKVAVYRDPGGALWALDPSCPHLGCIVEWNSGEKTWDCPCHGSRFDKSGQVLNGPAVANLTQVEVPPVPGYRMETGVRE